MPISLRFDRRGFGILVYTDPYTFEEFTETLESAIAAPAYQPAMPILSDRRHASAPSSTFVRLMTLLFERHREILRGTAVAILVSSTAAYGMARMQEVLAENADVLVRPFTDYDEAVQWLIGHAVHR
jgi:hypothetical protein